MLSTLLAVALQIELLSYPRGVPRTSIHCLWRFAPKDRAVSFACKVGLLSHTRPQVIIAYLSVKTLFRASTVVNRMRLLTQHSPFEQHLTSTECVLSPDWVGSFMDSFALFDVLCFL